MFLERKFSRHDPESRRVQPALCPALPHTDWSRLPEVVYDVLSNLQVLLSARRHYSHVFADFGLSPSDGQHGLEARIELLKAELPQTLGRYERRFRLDEVDVDVDDVGTPHMLLRGALLTEPGSLALRFGVIDRRIFSFEYERSSAAPR